jgi:hypothetical protein
MQRSFNSHPKHQWQWPCGLRVSRRRVDVAETIPAQEFNRKRVMFEEELRWKIVWNPDWKTYLLFSGSPLASPCHPRVSSPTAYPAIASLHCYQRTPNLPPKLLERDV